MAKYAFERPGLPTCYIDDSCVVKTQEEVDACYRIVEDALYEYMQRRVANLLAAGITPTEELLWGATK